MVAATFLGLDWSGEINAGDLLVGVGTLLLAGVTAWLAKRTSDEVDRSQEGIEVAQRGLEMHDWPFLVASPDAPTFDLSPTYDRDTGEPSGDPEWRCDVNLINYGRGPAILDGASLRNEAGSELVNTAWVVESIHLPEDEPTLVGIGLGDTGDLPVTDAHLTLRLLYRSATGVRYETSHRLLVRAHQRAIRLDFKQTRLGEIGEPRVTSSLSQGGI